MNVAQIDRDIKSLQNIARRLTGQFDHLSETQKNHLADILVYLCSCFLKLPTEGEIGSLLAENQNKRILLEAALKLSEQKIGELIRYAPAGIYEIDFRKQRITSVNDMMCQLSGYSREELLATNPFDLLDDQGKALFRQRINQWLDGEKPDESVEYRVKAKDGHEIYALLNVTFQADEDGKPIGATVIGLDVTERKKVEQALREATRQAEENRLILETVIEQMPAGIILTNASGSKAKNNHEMNRIWQRTMGVAENIQEHDYHAFHPDGHEYQPEEWPLSRALLKGEVVIGEEMTFVRGDGTKGVLYACAAPILDANGNTIAGVVIDVDITTQKRVQEELLARQAQVEAQRRLLDQREQERLQIARDLHDGPIQDLLGVVYEIQNMKENFADAALRDKLQAVQLSLKAAIGDLRAHSQELRPPALSSAGLEKAIQTHLATFEARHPDIKVRFTNQIVGIEIPENARLTLYRIYQEAIANLVKHSGASEVCVRLEGASGMNTGGIQPTNMVVLEVQDNGRGFRLPADWLELARKGHLGLVGMRERAEAAGGKMEIDAQPGAGTTVRVSLPVENA